MRAGALSLRRLTKRSSIGHEAPPHTRSILRDIKTSNTPSICHERSWRGSDKR
uniref:Uncharacterized protein n=1 Tax=Anguilla anguilla TaxID=7936 RepID=A0A0E9WEK7_ANGAN